MLGQIDPTYIRFTAAGTYHVRRAGPVIIPEDNMVVRALVENCRSDNAFSVAGGHQLNFIRGALGAKGEDGTGGGGGGSGDDAFDWATVGDTSLVPDAKLPVEILTGIDSFTYLDATRAIVLNFDRIDGSTNNGQIILPDFLDATEVWDWSLASNADRLPNTKLGLDVVIGITSVTYDTSTRNLRVRLPQADGGDTFQEATLPEFLAAADVQDWAETGNTDDIPDSKLPGTLIDSIDSFTYDVTSRILQLQLRRLNNNTIAGNVTLPQFLAEAAIETWALTANPNEDIPAAKLPAHTVGLLPSFDPGSNVFSLARTTSVGSTITTTTTFPEWAEEADLYDWAFIGNTDRLPYSEDSAAPAVAWYLRIRRGHARPDVQLFQNTTPAQQTRTITLPDYLTAADVVSFDIHDDVGTASPIQAPDRIPFSDENVAGESDALHPCRRPLGLRARQYRARPHPGLHRAGCGDRGMGAGRQRQLRSSPT